ncbi:MAG: hypothetical protein FJ291_19110 [Planctomycetes bacterium]|nr:hypothetical protein [Planctomycetota bacterium]
MRQGIADLERLISNHARTMADAMLAAAKAAGSEEDIRHECNKLLDQFISLAGLQVKGRHEYAIGGGRLDSKYQGVLLEYKHPKGPQRISEDADSPGARHVVAQIKQRFEDLERDEGYRPERLLGVGCDGDTIVFVRYRARKWEIEDPKPVTRHTVERLLRAIVSLGAQGHSFTPERLAEDFGADSSVPAAAIAALYQTMNQTRSRKAKMFFNQWKLLFGEVCGYNIAGENPKVAKLASHYHLAGGEPAPLLFAVHTYYAILMKFLAAEIAGSFSPLGTSVLKKCAAAATNPQLRREIAQLEQGGIWTQLGISNFLEGDLFSWYLPAWSEQTADAVRSIASALDDYDPATLSVEPTENRDLLKKLYQHLFPKSVRHDLGEYYTPDWLAEHVLNELRYDGDPDKRILDPACGSGTFLVMAINRVWDWFEQHAHECGFAEKELVAKIQSNVIGFDLNPLAVMAARTNYLLAVRDLLRFAARIEIPVYLCDSVITPAEHEETLLDAKGTRKLPTAAGEFIIPGEIATDRERVAKYADTLEFCIRNKHSHLDFLARCEEQGLPIAQAMLHRELYERISALQALDENGIWARIIKNAFAPLFVGRVHFIAGNPPWVNWEHLPPLYREKSKRIWARYGLLNLRGEGHGLGGVKRDLAMLFTYSALDNYLVDGGRLGFVITQTVFKSRGAGDGFRQLQFTRDKSVVVLRPVVVHDMSSFQPFEGATNRTAVLVCERSDADFEYPVTYVVWRRSRPFTQDSTLDEVLRATKRQWVAAAPIDKDAITSPWLTAPPGALGGLQKAIGKSHYTAHAGTCGWLNGVYWVRLIGELSDGKLLIENLHRVGKTKLEQVQRPIEPGLVYPLVRGRDVGRWWAQPSAHMILPQDPSTGAPLSEHAMKRRYALTLEYLTLFEKELRHRSGYRLYYKAKDPFYAICNVGPYTVSRYKVMWPEVATTVCAAVARPSDAKGDRPWVPDHTVVAVSCDEESEAHFVCALLNSGPAQGAILGYVVLHPSPHVLQFINVPRFNDALPLHRTLSELSASCHETVARGLSPHEVEAEIDEAAAQLWGITAAELDAIQAALRET